VTFKYGETFFCITIPWFEAHVEFRPVNHSSINGSTNEQVDRSPSAMSSASYAHGMYDLLRK